MMVENMMIENYEINIEKIFKNPLIEYIPKNSTLNARSIIRTNIEISSEINSHGTDDKISASIDEGITLRSEINNRYIKNSFSLDDDSLSNLIKKDIKNIKDIKDINEKNDLNYKESIRNINSSTIEEKIELTKFILDSLKERIKEKIGIRFIESIEFKIYADNKDAIFHNEGYLYIQMNIENAINESIGFNIIHNKLKDLYNFDIDKLREKIEMLKVPIVSGFDSKKPIILDNSLAGVFVHEVYGHTLEADNDAINKKNKLKIDHNIEITDSPLLKSGIVNYLYDDEGIPASENLLIKDGKVLNLIHNKESSTCLKSKPTGNGRADLHNSEVLPRMTNMIINKGDWNIEEAISELKQGYYAVGFDGGGHNPMFDNFSMSPHICFKIENGKIAGMLKNIYIAGNLKDSLKNIDIGNKQENTSTICFKKGQILMAGILSPFLKIDKLNIISN